MKYKVLVIIWLWVLWIAIYCCINMAFLNDKKFKSIDLVRSFVEGSKIDFPFKESDIDCQNLQWDSYITCSMMKNRIISTDLLGEATQAILERAGTRNIDSIGDFFEYTYQWWVILYNEKHYIDLLKEFKKQDLIRCHIWNKDCGKWEWVYDILIEMVEEWYSDNLMLKLALYYKE